MLLESFYKQGRLGKKIVKLSRQPDLFFFDFFKNRLLKSSATPSLHPDQTMTNLSSQAQTVSTTPTLLDDIPDILDGISPSLLFADQLYQKVLQKYSIASHIRLGDQDDRSFAIWDAQLPFLVKNLMHLLKIGFHIEFILSDQQFFLYQPHQGFSLNNLIQKLSSTKKFTFEAKHSDLPAVILEIYLANLSMGMFNLKSDDVFMKKIYPSPCENLIQPYKFPEIDVVYTWVDYQDPNWQTLWHQYFPEQQLDLDRFASNDELKFSLRSIAMYAPWVRNIYVLTNCRKPDWFKEHQRIIFIDHTQVFPNMDDLPTFNSHAIEACLQKIPNLSENFIYMNDDVFMNRPLSPLDFFDFSGRSFSFFEPYGMVRETTDISSESYMIAAHNSAKIIHKNFGVWPRQLHKHTPHALKKSVILNMERLFPEIYEETRKNRVRSIKDYSLVSFFYHHYSYLNGTSVKAECKYSLVRGKNYKKLFTPQLKEMDFFCINDGGGSATNQEFKKSSQELLQKKFRTCTGWEK